VESSAGASVDELEWPVDIFGSPGTALVTHSLCMEHGALPHDLDDPTMRHRVMEQTPENPHRLEILCGERGILRADCFRELRRIPEPAPAPLVDILRVHEYWYIHKLTERVKQASNSAIPLDAGDTKVTMESWNAALRACGCVLEAADLVCDAQVRNAFCAIRPPGHHLGPAGACNKEDLDDDPEGSQGFCLLNNVAVGAAYVRCVYRHLIRKVAIIDFDVHHGNGTEAIVRHVKEKPQHKSISHSVCQRGFSTKVVTTSPPSCKPWLDPESDGDNVFFASVHGFGGGFYPGSGDNCEEQSPTVINVALSPDSSSAEFRDSVRRKILPQLLSFNPDIIFLSSGFDGHEDDLIGNCCLADEDYLWITQQMLSVANRCCQGRLISVLEGGYNTRAETLSPFAQSVAGHVRTLMNTSPNFCYLESEAVQPGDPRGQTLLDADRSWVARRSDAKQARAGFLRRQALGIVGCDGPLLQERIATVSSKELGGQLQNIPFFSGTVTAEAATVGDAAGAATTSREEEEMAAVFGAEEETDCTPTPCVADDGSATPAPLELPSQVTPMQ